MIRITHSVGSKGKNLEKDVKRVQALMNTYLRTNNKAILDIDGKSSPTLELSIFNFQKDHMKLKNPTSKIDTTSATITALRKHLASIFVPIAITSPTYGEVTWASEGSEGGRYHSRKLTVPSSTSGLTIGRGYDMKKKTQTTIISNLSSAGISAKKIDTLKKAAGLSGPAAEWFIIENDLLDFQITPEQQKALFKTSYNEESSQVKRICEKSDTKELYGSTNWENLNSAIKDIAIDLKFRGDYTSTSRKIIQKSIAENNLSEFKKALKKKTNWGNVPKDRFDRRVAFLEKQPEPTNVSGAI